MRDALLSLEFRAFCVHHGRLQAPLHPLGSSVTELFH